MASVHRSNRTSLKEWEDWLAPQVRQVELLGEIPITADECAQLGKVIGLRLKNMGATEAVRIFQRNYPCSLAVFLVAQGIYGYRGGDYWSEVVQVTNLNRGQSWQMGQAFEMILEEMGLPLFYDMREEAQRYVSLILAHGGIPSYCLPDFFENMLQPSVIRMQYADMSAADLIDEWSWRSSVQNLTDKPVLRFLVYGDRVAEDFVERCRETAWEYLESGLVPDAEQVGLPERVVEAYRRWLAEQDASAAERETGDRWRLRKPDVVVDPWGEGVYLELPPQQVPAAEVDSDVSWQVKAGGETHILPVRVRRAGTDWKTTEESLPLGQPAAIYEVSLLANGQAKNTWRYQGIDGKHPLLVFDAERGTLQRLSYSLPARRLGLLYPAHVDLKVEGDARLVEEWPRMPWGWANFRGQTWDLDSADRIKVGDGQEILTVMLRPDQAKHRPTLMGGTLLQLEKPGVRAPVYEGPPPSVRIPLLGRRHLDEELARWRVTVQNKGAASPSLKITETLADSRSRLVIREGYVDLPLRHPSLLGEQPFGRYLVRLRGPLGRGAEFALRIVPHLAITGHEQLYLPDAQSGPVPATLHVETLPGYHLESEGAGGECRVEATNQQGKRWEYRAKVSPDVTKVELTLVRRLPSGDAVQVPVDLTIKRLRWALVEEKAETNAKGWMASICKLPVDALLQLGSPYLLVDLPVENRRVRLRLRLVDTDGAELQAADPRSLPAGHRLLRLDLTGFLDTVRHAHEWPTLRFELEVQGLPARETPLRLPVLKLSQDLLVQDVAIAHRQSGEVLSLTATWREPVRLRNRCLRFWPLWRPWQPFYEQPIPDEADGIVSFDAHMLDLPPAKYRLEFLTMDPWTLPELRMPSSDDRNAVDLELISPEQRLESLDTRLCEEDPCSEVQLERGVLCQELGLAESASLALRWCYEHLNEATVGQVLTLMDLALKAAGPMSSSDRQLVMFSANRLEDLEPPTLQEVTPQQLQSHLSELPRSTELPESVYVARLSVQKKRVKLVSVRQMIRRGVVAELDDVLTWIEDGGTSPEQAYSVIVSNSELIVIAIWYSDGMADANRLLDALAELLQDVLRVGSWVHCNFGWGRITRIEHVENDGHIEWCLKGDSRCRVILTLRPDLCEEEIAIDLGSSTADFPNPDLVYACGKCHSFATQSQSLLRLHYNSAHRPRNKAEARLPMFYHLEETPVRVSFLRSSEKAPGDQWM